MQYTWSSMQQLMTVVATPASVVLAVVVVVAVAVVATAVV